MAEEYIQVFTTTETKGDAEKIAKALVERRLAACAQIFGPLSSTYWWKGKLENAEEWGCFIKSTHVLYHELENELRQMHPYENPEIIVMPIVGGSKTYLEWIRGETKRPS
jgi:periplasmic divalent cation tolerance protein